MSPRKHRRADALFALSLALISGNVACWEQWSEEWFPQMKWQRAIQAFERVPHETAGKPALNPFMPPEGAVPQGAEPPVIPRLKPEDMNEQTLAAYDAAVATFVNPTRPDPAQPVAFQSLVRGKELWRIYCQTCHGVAGMGDGPVSMANLEKPGPFAGVFPVVTATSRSDGYIYNLIRGGGDRMPSYQRIAPEDRWHLVNYTRHLQMGGQP